MGWARGVVAGQPNQRQRVRCRSPAMWLVALFLSLLHTSMASADVPERQSPDWVQRAADLGLASAVLTFEYSLTDDCALGPISIEENTAEEIFDNATIDQIVRAIAGPFDVATDKSVRAGIPGFGAEQTLAPTSHMFNWNTDLGHEYVVCRFYADGRFADAYYTDDPSSKVIEDRPVARRLSRLGTRTHTVSFERQD